MYTINTQTPTLPRTHSHLPKQTLTLPTCTVSLTTIAHSHTTHTENMHTLPENKQGGHEPSITRSVSISINPVQAYSADGKAAPPPHIPALYCTVRKALLAAVSLTLDSLKWSPLPPPYSKNHFLLSTVAAMTSRHGAGAVGLSACPSFPTACKSAEAELGFYRVPRWRQIYKRATSSWTWPVPYVQDLL